MTRNIKTLDEFEGDVIDVRDVIARFEELETELNDAHDDADENDVLDMRAEFATLESLLDDLKGYGGDEQWRGSWYPVTLIAESYFTDYCEELVSDIGDLPRDIPGYLVIDWEATADNLRVDYSTVDFNGNSYLYR